MGKASNDWEIVLSRAYKKQVKKIQKRVKNQTPNLVNLLQVYCQVIRYNLSNNCRPGSRELGDRLSGCKTNEVYKYRIPGDNVGKSGGFRLIYAVLRDNNTVLPLLIYQKTKKEKLTRNELVQIVIDINEFVEGNIE